MKEPYQPECPPAGSSFGPDLETGAEIEVFAQRVEHRAVAIARQRDRALHAVLGYGARHLEMQARRQQAPWRLGTALAVESRSQRAWLEASLGQDVHDIRRHAAGQRRG